MFNIFKKEETEKDNNHPSIMAVACLLIHSAKIDENYTDKEKKIVSSAIIKLGAQKDGVDKILSKAEKLEKESNQILDFTKEVKNFDEQDKIEIVETLWNIIYSDNQSDIYEANLMRRLSGLLYLDNKIVGDIKERVKSANIK